MLSMSKVLYYIKVKMGYPHVIIEKSDDEMETYIKMFTLQEFSMYVPDEAELALLTDRDRIEDADVRNSFRLIDAKGLSILSVKAVIQSEGMAIMHGQPYEGPYLAYDALPEYAMLLQIEDTKEKYSRASVHYEFMPPNVLRLFPGSKRSAESKYIVRYDRIHTETLETIPVEYEMDFMNMCLADIMMICGSIRNKYQNISTPFGDIPINAEISTAAMEIKAAIITKLQNLYYDVPVIID